VRRCSSGYSAPGLMRYPWRFSEHPQAENLLLRCVDKAHAAPLGQKANSVDFNRRLLTVEGRNAKNRQTRHVPLNDEAVSVLRNWREQSGTGARAFRVATGFRTA